MLREKVQIQASNGKGKWLWRKQKPIPNGSKIYRASKKRFVTEKFAFNRCLLVHHSTTIRTNVSNPKRAIPKSNRRIAVPFLNFQFLLFEPIDTVPDIGRRFSRFRYSGLRQF